MGAALKNGIRILYEDNHLLVAVKPANLPVMGDSSGDEDMLTALKAYVKEKYAKPGDVYLGLVHRLDRPVSGVMVFARTSKAASRLSSQFSGREAKKRYMALVDGKPAPEATLEGYIVKDEATGKARLCSEGEPGAKRALLKYTRLASHGGSAMVEVELFTGRHHQIRLQLEGAGIPIVNDQRYNRNAVPGGQIALFAYSLSFTHPTRKERLTFTAMPEGREWREYAAECAALANGVRVVYSDADMLAVNKQTGMSVTEEDGGDSIEARLKLSGLEAYPVHRLDVATRGLVLFARNAPAKDALDEAIRERTIRKLYLAEVYGAPEGKSGELRAYLTKDAAAARVYVTDAPSPGAVGIVTRYELIERRGETSLVRIELVTGRTHQIRAHMAHIGCPLVGDDKYGDFARDRETGNKFSLEAARLEFSFPKGSYLERLNGTVIDITE